MATVDLSIAARGNHPRGRQPYMIQNEINFATAATSKGTALAAADIIKCLTVPAESVVLHAGFEVTAAHAGTSTDTAFDFGVTGGDVDNFVDGFDFDGASVGAYAPTPAAYAAVTVGGTADTIDLLLQAMTGTTTGGKIRCFATLMDISDAGDMAANEVDRDTLA
jgi:hypothetical protein